MMGVLKDLCYVFVRLYAKFVNDTLYTKLWTNVAVSRHILFDADDDRDTSSDGIAQSYYIEEVVCSVGPSRSLGVVGSVTSDFVVAVLQSYFPDLR